MPYRDDAQALQAEKERLEQERARIEEHKRMLASLSDDEARVRRDLADVERRLAKRKKSLPLLGEVRVASPCNADWNLMSGDEKARYCKHCDKNVYNLSAMTTEQAEALIREHEKDLCVRYYQRADGTVMTADCPVGVRKKRVRKAAFAAIFGAAAGGALYTFEESTIQGKMVAASEARMGKFEAFDDDQVLMKQVTMGGMVPVEEEDEQDGVEEMGHDGAGKPLPPDFNAKPKSAPKSIPHKKPIFTRQ